MRRGTTLIELVIACALVGALALITLPTLRDWRDRIAVRSAAHELFATLAVARHSAIATGNASVHLRAHDATVVVLSGTDTLHRRPLGELHGVTLLRSGELVRYGPTGRGVANANTTVAVLRGSAADTLWVSRLGRVRRSARAR